MSLQPRSSLYNGMDEPTRAETLESAFLLVLITATIGAGTGWFIGKLLVLIVHFVGL